MIQANELRIGNYVKCKVSNDAGIYKVLSLDGWMIRIMLDGVRQNEWHPERLIMPIPLTPEILGKCGFEKINHIHGYSFYSMIRKGKHNGNPAIDIYDNRTTFMSYPVSHCQYLHQLQNLVFSLTGSELNYTP